MPVAGGDAELAQRIKSDGVKFGFQGIGFSDIHLDKNHHHYQEWIEKNYHGEMAYMERNVEKRLNPEILVPSTLSVICVRMDYLTEDSQQSIDLLDHPSKAYVSRYALGRDYHKLIRKRLQKFALHLTQLLGEFGYRVFTDSAPVMEKALAVSM